MAVKEMYQGQFAQDRGRASTKLGVEGKRRQYFQSVRKGRPSRDR